MSTIKAGIESPHLNITKRWVTLEIRQLITNGGYGVVLWQGAAEPYGKRSATIFNDFQNRQMTHLVSLGHVSDLEHILIRPTNDVSRVLIPHIAVYTFQLVSASTP